MGCSNSLSKTHGRTALGISKGGDGSGGYRSGGSGRGWGGGAAMAAGLGLDL